MIPRIFLFVFVCLTAVFFNAKSHGAEVFEIGKNNFDELPGGKEADGIVGDFLLRNDKVEVVISGNLPLRRPNMGGFYGDGNHTPGTIYDLTKRDADNDQITIFVPCGQKGPVNYVRIIEDGSGENGRAVIETMVSAAKSGGLFKRHRYILEDGWDGVLVQTVIRNEGTQREVMAMWDVWTQMRIKGNFQGIDWADAIDPSDRHAYARGWVMDEGATEIPEKRDREFNVGDEAIVARFLAVGNSPAEAIGHVMARQKESMGSLKVKMTADGDAPIKRGKVTIDFGGEKGKINAYPDDEGTFTIPLKEGTYPVTIVEMGRKAQYEELTIKAGEELAVDVKLPKQAAVNFTVRDEAGVSIPCKAQFNAMEGTEKPYLGPTDRAHGCVDQWHSESGDFRVPIKAGKYEVIITRGPEFSHHRQEIEVTPAGETSVKATLKRLVDTTGWIATDYHNHSTPSGDNTCGTDDRLINLAAEHIEFAPTTEHNRLYDWEPHIEKLGLTPFVKTIPGMELTGRGAHFNCFPLKPEPMKQDGGAPVWNKDPRINALTLRNWQGEEADRWVHLNHPDMSENFVDWNRDGRADGGYAYFGGMLNGLESQNYRSSNILADAPFRISKAKGGLGNKVDYVREFIWLQMLNQGITVWGIGVADAHHVHGNGVGSWRTYVPSSTDDPAEVDWREMTRHSKAGRMILSSGPFLEVETESGIIAGGYDRVSEKLNLNVKVQCTDWIDIDRVQVLVNGRQLPELNFTREKNADMFGDGVVKFEQTIPVSLTKDAHIIVVAIGENHTLKTGFGTSAQSSIQPCAYNNPIFIDVDGGGFQASYDTLGYDLPTHRLSVERVQKLLEQ